jgi:hypothetical protein
MASISVSAKSYRSMNLACEMPTGDAAKLLALAANSQADIGAIMASATDLLHHRAARARAAGEGKGFKLGDYQLAIGCLYRDAGMVDAAGQKDLWRKLETR